MDFMIDLETLGTNEDAHVLECSIVAFDFSTFETKKVLECRFGLDDQKGASVSQSTLRWWLKDKKETFDFLYQNPTHTFESFLKALNQLLSQTDKRSLRIWSAGNFDVPILNNALKRYGFDQEIPFWTTRDVRGFRDICQAKKYEIQQHIAHTAYDDCLRQIQYIKNVVLNLQ